MRVGQQPEVCCKVTGWSRGTVCLSLSLPSDLRNSNWHKTLGPHMHFTRTCDLDLPTLQDYMLCITL